MEDHPRIRLALVWTQVFVAVTAVAGGVALAIGSLSTELMTLLSPPAEYLAGSPFGSYLVPGLILAVVLGGVHVAAFVAVVRLSGSALVLSAAAGYATLIWIFVQMMFIPFSPLQLLYFAVGSFELGLVMLLLGLLPTRGTLHRAADARADRGLGGSAAFER
ncbi:hypothetical protein [Agromyces sp. S2-1-8]|uniref:hypothetical protein n=1 Tax=Agromyces sp. S2-1-8 TaxID=2897180 RepID=UPI001E35F61A|nr:hypothetical protein [Agromyces sp. S2-1-8]MCD5348257.1 hypothetical protein [Agromyces sp. S2-1-8]